MLQNNNYNNFFFLLCLKFNLKNIKYIQLIYIYFILFYTRKQYKKPLYIWNYHKNVYSFSKIFLKSSKQASISKVKFYSILKKPTKLLQKKKLKSYIYKFLQFNLKKTNNFFNFFYTKNSNILKVKAHFSLKQRLFLSQRFITQQIWSFLYKSVSTNFYLKNKAENSIEKTKDVKRLFFNFHKPLIWKMRKARYVHWELRTRGKLNKYRYDKLLGRELVYRLKTKYIQLLACVFFITYYSVLSWKQMLLAINYNLILINSKSVGSSILNINKGDIIELPYGLNYRKVNINLYTNVIKKSKKVVYKLYKHKWFLKNKKNKLVPKIFKKLPVGVQLFGKNLAYDPVLNIFAVIYNLPKTTHNLNWNITKSSVLSLQNWRYNFN